MTFVRFPGKTWEEILPNASAEGRDLVSQLIRYQSTERLKAADVSSLLELHLKCWIADNGTLQVQKHAFFDENTKAGTAT